MLVAGDVIRLWDGNVRPPAYKRFLVVYPEDGWLLRINSQPHWKPNFPLLHAANAACLDRDCFLELNGVIEYIQSELDNADILGRLSDATLQNVIAHLPTVYTLSEADCTVMVGAISATLPSVV